MKYRKDRYGNDISILGYGCMRFTQKNGHIDLDKAEKELLLAVEAGVNYFDTAYTYPGNEEALGELLERNHLRDRVKIATKLPHYKVKKASDPEKFFSEELKRLRTDHIDYYLMHMLSDTGTWNRLKELGMEEWLEEKKAKGVIGQIGFSYHGNSDTFIELLNARDWDFCQIQYNYLDENSQAGVTGLKAAAAKGIPVIIMEPLRGGRLVKDLPGEAREIFQKEGAGDSPAAWAFRWLWNQPEVTCVLSGMNSPEMVEENVKLASRTETGNLTEADLEMFRRVVEAIQAKMKVGCTGCRYCMPCPSGVDIPGTFSAYNHKFTDGYFTAFREYFMCTALRRDSAAASQCVGCGKCEKICPQHIEIRKELKNAGRALETPVYKVGRAGVKLLKMY